MFRVACPMQRGSISHLYHLLSFFLCPIGFLKKRENSVVKLDTEPTVSFVDIEIWLIGHNIYSI
jgi:hypothetical protein